MLNAPSLICTWPARIRRPTAIARSTSADRTAEFNPKMVQTFAHQHFGFTDCDERFVSRGGGDWSILAGRKTMEQPHPPAEPTPEQPAA